MSKIVLFSSIALLFATTNVSSQNVYTTTNNTDKVGIGYSNGSTLPEAFNIRRVGSIGDLVYDIHGNAHYINGIYHAAIRLDYRMYSVGTPWRYWEIRNNGNFQIFYKNNEKLFLNLSTNNLIESLVDFQVKNSTTGRGMTLMNTNNQNYIQFFNHLNSNEDFIIQHKKQTTTINLMRFKANNTILAEVPITFNEASNFNNTVNINGNLNINSNLALSKLLIGTEDQTNGPHIDYKLCVDGKIVAKRFITTQYYWADFVFDEFAQNPSLEDEIISIKTNKTLVGVPSENDVKSGRDLAETDIILLMKLEQAYLHIIELNKRIEVMEDLILNRKK